MLTRHLARVLHIAMVAAFVLTTSCGDGSGADGNGGDGGDGDVECDLLGPDECEDAGCVLGTTEVRHYDEDAQCNALAEVPVCHASDVEWGCGNAEAIATDTPGQCYRFFTSGDCLPPAFTELQGEPYEACFEKIENAMDCE